MELIRGLHNLRPRHRGTVLTVGNFDGVHRGHQAVLAGLRACADAAGLPLTVMLFEPQPQEFFQGSAAPARLNTLREKLERLAQLGVDRVLCIRFNQALRSLTAERFVDDILVQGLGVQHLVIGDDFRFGCDRRGDFAFLQQAGAEQGFTVADTATVCESGERISSTRLREYLRAGQLQEAAALLGETYSISGRVQHGDKLGRQLGFATANIALKRAAVPLSGVYVVRVQGVGMDDWPGVANVGSRPTVNGLQPRLEVHLLDFAGDIYGQHLRVHFLQQLRGEKKFGSLDELKAAIAENVQQTRDWFAQSTGIAPYTDHS